VEGCITTSTRFAAGYTSRRLILTGTGHPFVAWITVEDLPYNEVGVLIYTTESAVFGVGDAFKNRFPVTYRLARAVLGDVISAMFFGP